MINMKKKTITIFVIFLLLIVSIGASISTSAYSTKNTKSNNLGPSKPKILDFCSSIQGPSDFNIPANWIMPGYDFDIVAQSSDDGTFNQELIEFKIDWGDESTSEWLEGSNLFLGKNVWRILITHSYFPFLSTPITLEIRVQAKDRHGRTSEWSDPLEVYVTRNPYENEIGLRNPDSWYCKSIENDQENKYIVDLPEIFQIREERGKDQFDVSFSYYCKPKSQIMALTTVLYDSNDVSHNVFSFSYDTDFDQESFDLDYDMEIPNRLFDIDYDSMVEVDRENNEKITFNLAKSIVPEKIRFVLKINNLRLKAAINGDKKFIDLEPFVIESWVDVSPGFTVEGKISSKLFNIPFPFVNIRVWNEENEKVKTHEEMFLNGDYVIYPKKIENYDSYTIGAHTYDYFIPLNRYGESEVTGVENLDHFTDVDIYLEKIKNKDPVLISKAPQKLGWYPFKNIICGLKFIRFANAMDNNNKDLANTIEDRAINCGCDWAGQNPDP